MAFRVAISSMSLGRAQHHSFQAKLRAAAQYGLEGIEIFYEDLQIVAKHHTANDELAAAKLIRKWCSSLSLKIISLQPCFVNEGILDRAQWGSTVKKMRHMCAIAVALGTDLLLIPSSIHPPPSALSSDLDFIASDLRTIAHLGLKFNLRFAYESLCWGVRSSTWETSWDLVQRVNMRNFGLCLDTFNIAGRVYADPASPTGCTPNAHSDLAASLARLKTEVDPSRVFLVQVVDAEKLSTPLTSSHKFYNPSQPARMSWSRNCRLFYGERKEGGYLPVDKVSEAIFNGLKWKGWVSMELFSRSMESPAKEVPWEHARRARRSWACLVRECNLRLDDGESETGKEKEAVEVTRKDSGVSLSGEMSSVSVR